MATIPEALAVALQHHQAGRLQQAEAIYRQILQIQPQHADAAFSLGVVHQQQGQLAEATSQYRRALALRPAFAEAHNNLGTVLAAQGMLAEALGHYQQALALKPDYAEAHFNLGNALKEQGKLEAASAACRQAIGLKPEYAEAIHNLAVILQQQGKLDEAITHYQKVITLQSGFAGAYYNLAVACQQQGRLDEATIHYQQAIALRPENAEAHFNLGNALKERGILNGAIDAYLRAIALKSEYADAYTNLGAAYEEHGKFEQAATAYRQAVLIQPSHAEAHNNLANVLKDQGEPEAAVARLRQALAIKPSLEEADSNLLMAMSYSPRFSVEEIAQAHQAWNDRHARALALQMKPFTNDRDPDRRLRVGYVSGDFRTHSVTYFFRPLLAAHDRSTLEVFCYSNGVRPDSMTLQLQRLSDGWRDIGGMQDEAIADLIRADRVDILVDLSGHTRGNRLLVFARKPAPVQVTYLGYGTTTGLSAMDYRLTDRFLTPPGTPEWFSEELIHLSGCYHCYEPPKNVPTTSLLPMSRAGYVTFGSFNALAKVTAEVIRVWAEILRAVPQARLILKDRTSGDAAQRRRYAERFAEHGIGVARLAFLSWSATPAEHTALYDQIDIALDPFPYNGATTTCEALWMGVPVLTLAGRMSFGRYGVSFLSFLGLEDLIATSPAAYVAKAVALAGQPDHLAALRSSLRPRMAASPVCDARAHAQSMERAYRLMWRRWCRSS
jgi:predicted O-linked N-acetylglucosamine transferase (SPINDLY family)